MKSYQDLTIYQKGLELYYRTHPLSLQLPKFELYELGSQIRRSADSAVTNVVEGYGRRRYKADFLKFLTYAHASCLETICHIEKIITMYAELKGNFIPLQTEYDILSAQIYKFIQYVERNWKP